MYKKYQLLLEGGLIVVILSEETDLVKLFSWVKSQNDVVFFYKTDRSLTVISGCVLDPLKVIGIDDVYADEGLVDLEKVKEKKRILAEKTKKR
jgi:hypothetical protein